MVCECCLLATADGVEIHKLPDDLGADLCEHFAYLKFEVDGDAQWLCPLCLGHYKHLF